LTTRRADLGPAVTQKIAPEARGDEARIALTTPPRERQPVLIEHLNIEAATKGELSRMRQANVRAPCRKVQTSGE